MKIIYNSLIPFPGFSAMNLFGIMFARKEYKGRLNEYTINHESIHTEQMKELGFVPFYIIYLIEWFIRLFMKGNAYRNISFEQEAYEHDRDLSYLENRKRYNWLKYWGIKKG